MRHSNDRNRTLAMRVDKPVWETVYKAAAGTGTYWGIGFRELLNAAKCIAYGLAELLAKAWKLLLVVIDSVIKLGFRSLVEMDVQG